MRAVRWSQVLAQHIGPFPQSMRPPFILSAFCFVHPLHHMRPSPIACPWQSVHVCRLVSHFQHACTHILCRLKCERSPPDGYSMYPLPATLSSLTTSYSSPSPLSMPCHVFAQILALSLARMVRPHPQCLLPLSPTHTRVRVPPCPRPSAPPMRG